MKILLVVHQFFPAFTAGTEVLTLGVARELRARGHEVRIFSGHPGEGKLPEAERCDSYLYEDFVVYRFHHAYVPMAGQVSMVEIGSDNHLAARYFSGVLADFGPHRVHYFHLNRLGTGLIVEAERALVKQSMTPTDFWAVCPTAQLRYPDGRLCNGPSPSAGNCVKHFAQNPSQSSVVRRLARALPIRAADAAVRMALASRSNRLPFLDEMRALGRRLPKTVDRLNKIEHILAPNAFMRGKLVEHGVDAHRISDLAFGVQLPRAPSLAPTSTSVAMASRDKGPLRLGFIGTLAPHKGALVLVQAFQRLKPGAATLRLYGNPTEFPDYLEELRAAATSSPGIEFAGVFPSDAIFDILAGLDVLLVPSLWYENTPLVIYSAQAAGKIVVASDFPGISEAVRDEVDGLLFTPGDASALARQIDRLMDSVALRDRLRSAVKPPKSIAAYATEMLQLWEAE